LLDLKSGWGFTDPRTSEEYKDCDICANDIFRDSWEAAGVARKAFPAPDAMPARKMPSSNGGGSSFPTKLCTDGSANGNLDQAQLVKTITDMVMKQLGGQC